MDYKLSGEYAAFAAQLMGLAPTQESEVIDLSRKASAVNPTTYTSTTNLQPVIGVISQAATSDLKGYSPKMNNFNSFI